MKRFKKIIENNKKRKKESYHKNVITIFISTRVRRIRIMRI